MYRLVVDTNVVISSLWGGNPRELVDLWQNGAVHVVSSQEIIEEYMMVLARFGLAKVDLKKWAESFFGKTEKVKLDKDVQVIDEDLSDNLFLECADKGLADYIISGDRHLLKLKKYKGIKIIKMAEFLNIYNGKL